MWWRRSSAAAAKLDDCARAGVVVYVSGLVVGLVFLSRFGDEHAGGRTGEWDLGGPSDRVTSTISVNDADWVPPSETWRKMAARGRGRGRGRGGGPGAQFLPRDDAGNIVFNKKPDGPPPLFPKIERFPDLPIISKRDEILVARRHHLQKAWECSPYYTEKTKAKAEGIVAEIDRYSDRYRTNKRANRVPLTSVLKLTGASFPVELLGQGRGRGRRVLPAGSTPWLLQTSLAKTDLHRLDQLASLEQKRLKDEEKGEKDGEEKKPGEGDDADGENEELEDEEEDLGDDDYAQTFGFDDDDDYDVDDGGDDDGPIF